MEKKYRDISCIGRVMVKLYGRKYRDISCIGGVWSNAALLKIPFFIDKRIRSPNISSHFKTEGKLAPC